MQTDVTEKTPEKKPRLYTETEAKNLIEQMRAEGGYTKERYEQLLTICEQNIIDSATCNFHFEQHIRTFLRDIGKLPKNDDSMECYKNLLSNAYLSYSHYAACMLNQLLALICLHQNDTTEAERHIVIAQNRAAKVTNANRKSDISSKFAEIKQEKEKKYNKGASSHESRKKNPPPSKPTQTSSEPTKPVRKSSPSTDESSSTSEDSPSVSKKKPSTIPNNGPSYNSNSSSSSGSSSTHTSNFARVSFTLKPSKLVSSASSEISAEKALDSLNENKFSMEAFEVLLDYYCTKKFPTGSELFTRAEKTLRFSWQAYFDKIKTKTQSLFKENKYDEIIKICDQLLKYNRAYLLSITSPSAAINNTTKKSDDIAYLYLIKAKSHLALDQLVSATEAINKADEICDRRKSQHGIVTEITETQAQIKNPGIIPTSTTTTNNSSIPSKTTTTEITETSTNKSSDGMEIDTLTSEPEKTIAQSPITTKKRPLEPEQTPASTERPTKTQKTTSGDISNSISGNHLPVLPSSSSLVPTLPPLNQISTTPTCTEVTTADKQDNSTSMELSDNTETAKKEYEQKIESQNSKILLFGCLMSYGLPKVQAHIRRQNDTQKTWDYLKEESVKELSMYLTNKDHPPTTEQSVAKVSLVSKFSESPSQDSFAKLAQFVNQCNKPADYKTHLDYKHTKEQLQKPGKIPDEEKKFRPQ